MSEFWNTNLILGVLSGSRAYGLDDEHSDTDTKGVCVPPKEVLFGLDEFEQWEDEGHDNVVYLVRKVIELALKGNPSILEILFTDERDVLHIDEWGRMLLDAKESFLFHDVGGWFRGFAVQQLKRLERHRDWTLTPPVEPPDPKQYGAVNDEGGIRFFNIQSQKAYKTAHKQWTHYLEWKKNRNPVRRELEEKHGYDTKHAMHLCRLMKMSGEIFESGEIRVRRDDGDWLKSVKAGRFSYNELIEWVRDEEARIEELEKLSKLPEKPDRDAANRLLVAIQEGYLFSR